MISQESVPDFEHFAARRLSSQYCTLVFCSRFEFWAKATVDSKDINVFRMVSVFVV